MLLKYWCSTSIHRRWLQIGAVWRYYCKTTMWYFIIFNLLLKYRYFAHHVFVLCALRQNKNMCKCMWACEYTLLNENWRRIKSFTFAIASDNGILALLDPSSNKWTFISLPSMNAPSIGLLCTSVRSYRLYLRLSDIITTNVAQCTE